MTGFIARRLVQSIVVVLLVTVIVFILLHLLPGGPARAQLGPRATPVAIDAFNHRMGYDRPIPVQYWTWLEQLATGNLGFSVKLNQSVLSLIGERLPKTLILTILSTLFALVVAIPLGMVQAVRRNQVSDYAITFWAFVFYATPPFFLGVVLIVVFSVYLPILPAEAPQSSSLGVILSQPAGLILPVLTLALLTVAQFSRYMRSAVIENLAEDYVRTARSKGAGERTVLVRHVLRNSLIPIATLLGLSLPAIFSGALITEAVFNFPGMGELFWTAAQTQDYPIMLGITVLVGLATVIGSLLADLAYAALDPRVRFA
ncbi:MAG TPA: ABC transporter permease [Pseudonocardia sp.]|jgi:peptide/nickel transport system permease protein|uniref:ABC transporter permease n=1 Tax=Pseudonocardia sp. TaxID=60912 RepID=UPI002C682EB1|nr:ABC transporter permease [Pseudonocardia sp.]HTF47711.1 ABC transporter permease [Pseudonocardia sp.]